MSQSSYILVNDFKWPAAGFPVEYFHQIQKLDLGDGDLVLNTYLKCGTNWTAYIIWEILNDGRSLPQPNDLLGCLMPFVDKFGTEKLADVQRDPTSYRSLITHIKLPDFPYSDSTKYIVTVRNPFDCCVSLHHFLQSKIVQIEYDGNFDRFFEEFLQGDILYGDFFDHLCPWYERRNYANVMILIYEEMVQDRKRCILELAEFLGKEYSKKMEGELLEIILAQTSFEHMKVNLNYASIEQEGTEHKKDSAFLRKGIVGDWKTLFSDDQKQRLKEKMQDRLRGTQLLEYWLKTLQI